MWRGVALCGVASRGVAWRGVAWRGAAWRGVVWQGMVWLHDQYFPVVLTFQFNGIIQRMALEQYFLVEGSHSK